MHMYVRMKIIMDPHVHRKNLTYPKIITQYVICFVCMCVSCVCVFPCVCVCTCACGRHAKAISTCGVCKQCQD